MSGRCSCSAAVVLQSEQATTLWEIPAWDWCALNCKTQAEHINFFYKKRFSLQCRRPNKAGKIIFTVGQFAQFLVVNEIPDSKCFSFQNQQWIWDNTKVIGCLVRFLLETGRLVKARSFKWYPFYEAWFGIEILNTFVTSLLLTCWKDIFLVWQDSSKEGRYAE